MDCEGCGKELIENGKSSPNPKNQRRHCNAVCRRLAHRKKKATAILSAVARIEAKLRLLGIDDSAISADLQAIKYQSPL